MPQQSQRSVVLEFWSVSSCIVFWPHDENTLGPSTLHFKILTTDNKG